MKKCSEQRIRRVDYQVDIWKRADVADPYIPDPTDGHCWTVGADGKLEPLWTDGYVLPQQLVDLLNETDSTNSSGDKDETADLKIIITESEPLESYSN